MGCIKIIKARVTVISWINVIKDIKKDVKCSGQPVPSSGHKEQITWGKTKKTKSRKTNTT